LHAHDVPPARPRGELVGVAVHARGMLAADHGHLQDLPGDQLDPLVLVQDAGCAHPLVLIGGAMPPGCPRRHRHPMYSHQSTLFHAPLAPREPPTDAVRAAAVPRQRASIPSQGYFIICRRGGCREMSPRTPSPVEPAIPSCVDSTESCHDSTSCGVYCAKISWTRLRTRSRAARAERAPSTEHRGGATTPWERGRLARWRPLRVHDTLTPASRLQQPHPELDTLGARSPPGRSGRRRRSRGRRAAGRGWPPRPLLRQAHRDEGAAGSLTGGTRQKRPSRTPRCATPR
jgi:hypothetical protein